MVEHKYNDGHEHDWFSPLGAPEKCALCGIGKTAHESKLMEDGLKYRKNNKVRRTITLGLKSTEAVISDACRERHTEQGAFEIGIKELKEKYDHLCKVWKVGQGVKFHLVLTIEKQA